jgi:hypothetical protein
MRVVEFVKAYPPYNAGERANFEPDVAGRLVARGIAEKVEAPASTPEAPSVSLPDGASTPPAKGKKG